MTTALIQQRADAELGAAWRRVNEAWRGRGSLTLTSAHFGGPDDGCYAVVVLSDGRLIAGGDDPSLGYADELEALEALADALERRAAE